MHQPELGKSNQQQNNIGHVDIGAGDPYNAGDIREALGFDRNDPNVHVQFIPLPRGEGWNDRVAAGEETSGYVNTDKYIPVDEQAPWTGAYSGGPKVTAPVTEPDPRPDRLIDLINDETRVVKIVMDVIDALIKAKTKHANMHSAHEGHSVIREEFEELWDHVKADTGKSPEARKEALQLAAMAIRYVLDVIDAPA